MKTINEVLLLVIFFVSLYSLVKEVGDANTRKKEWFYRISYGIITIGSLFELFYAKDVFLATFRLGVLIFLFLNLKFYDYVKS